MAKGDVTRERVIARAADVFSTRGYVGASMTDLLREVGLQKGGLYNHFASKEELALESFDYAVGLIAERFRVAVEAHDSALDRLLAVVGVIRSLVDSPLLPGGCPVLNTAIEADDTHPVLRERARGAMTAWQKLIGSIARDGIRRGELRDDVDPRALATIITATLEGAVMLSKLYGDTSHMKRAAQHVSAHIRSLATVPAPQRPSRRS
jgi:AcrR family transcriptional regulator